MDFNNLFTNQPNIVKMINKSFNNNRLSQVYLFYGEKGTLKMDAALYLASFSDKMSRIASERESMPIPRVESIITVFSPCFS